MDYYVVQVRAGTEAAFKQAVYESSFLNKKDFTIIFPQRVLKIRKKGIVSDKQVPLFPGYLFVETERFTDTVFRAIKKVKGFYRFLPDSMEPKPLFGRDLEILNHFMTFGGVAKLSLVDFDENDKIVILEGPLQGLEGKIVKVDKRKGRAKVRLDMFRDSFLIDFGFKQISVSEKGKEGKNVKTAV